MRQSTATEDERATVRRSIGMTSSGGLRAGVALFTCAIACGRAPASQTAPQVRSIEASTTAVGPRDAAAPLTAPAAAPEASAHEPSPEAGPLADPLDGGDAGSSLATLFDGAPTGDVRLGESRCAPWCLQYPKGWLSTDDNGFVYAWFFRGEGQYGTAEVMRSPLPKLDDAGIALRLRFAGGENVSWSSPVEGVVGKDHAPAMIAEGIGTSRGRKAHFWYAYVDLGRRKDLVIAYVVDGEPPRRRDETIAVVKSVRIADGKTASSP